MAEARRSLPKNRGDLAAHIAHLRAEMRCGIDSTDGWGLSVCGIQAYFINTCGAGTDEALLLADAAALIITDYPQLIERL